MVYGVIMAGGKGTRLWPEGRRGKPKQLLALIDDRPMIQVAVERLAPLVPVERQLIATTEEYAPMIAEALPDFPRENILAEPEGKNTAPCIGWSAVKVMERSPEAVMAVVTADHVVADEEGFRDVLGAALVAAGEERRIVTVGLTPTRPDTGLGYVRFANRLKDIGGIPLYRVAAFVEKPDLPTAEDYLDDGRYLWNSGMFILQASYALDLFERHLPKHHEELVRIQKHLGRDDERRVTEEAYRAFEPISVDYGIMEHAESVTVIRGDFGWLDVGTWPVLDLVRSHDAHGNVIDGAHIGADTENCIIRSKSGLVATLGVRDLVIIDTPDALLVCPKRDAQRVREIVDLLSDAGRDDCV